MSLFVDFFAQGSWVMFILVFESTLGLAIIINLLHYLFLKNDILDKTLVFKLSRRVGWLSHLASLSTMTGLLGTVLGIYHSFRSMKEHGKVSLELFSSGISEALITTIYGLVVAILFIFFYHILVDKIENLESLYWDRSREID